VVSDRHDFGPQDAEAQEPARGAPAGGGAQAPEPRVGGCGRPFRTQSGVWVRCGSRVASSCASCAELYRGDWAAIARSGVFEARAEDFRFYLLTLTAPSFGRVHRVPRSAAIKHKRCACGVTHHPSDVDLRGVPLDADGYDYMGQVAWNRDAGTLWDRTRRRLRDRWDSAEFFVVREWQDRGVLHLHVLVRVARPEFSTREDLAAAARTAVAVSSVDGTIVGWGNQVDVKQLRVGGDGARTIWYLSKALNYVMKDAAREALSAQRGRAVSRVWRHLIQLERAARSTRCSLGCVPGDCGGRSHTRYGARSHVVSATRRTNHRTGWSFSGLTRTLQRLHRQAWVESMRAPAAAPSSASAIQVDVMLSDQSCAARPRSGVAP
jgi:hypothetical protein